MVAGLMLVYLSASLPLAAAIPLMVLLTVLLGFIIERAAYKPLRTAAEDVRDDLCHRCELSAAKSGHLCYRRSASDVPRDSGPVRPADIAGVSTKYVTVITPVLVVVLVVALTQLTTTRRSAWPCGRCPGTLKRRS